MSTKQIRDGLVPAEPYHGKNLSYLDADKSIQRAYYAAQSTPMGGPVKLTAAEQNYKQRAKIWRQHKGIGQ